jgi:hypothetical protein
MKRALLLVGCVLLCLGSSLILLALEGRRAWCRRFHKSDHYETPTLTKVRAACLRCGVVHER